MPLKTSDPFLRELRNSNTFWVAKISDTEYIWQDDNRPSVTPKDAWLRLIASGKYPTELWIKFRSNEICIANNLDEYKGVYFTKAVLGTAGLQNNIVSGDNTTVINSVDMYTFMLINPDNSLVVKSFRLPDLEEISQSTTDIDGKGHKLGPAKRILRNPKFIK